MKRKIIRKPAPPKRRKFKTQLTETELCQALKWSAVMEMERVTHSSHFL